MSKLVNILRIFKNNSLPIDSVIKKAKFFLEPQISYIEKTYDNKFYLVDIYSMAYSLAIAEELSEHRMVSKSRRMSCLLGIFGEDYEPRFTQLFHYLSPPEITDDNYNQQVLSAIIEEVRPLAVSDIKKGMFFGNKYLAERANDLYNGSGTDLEDWEELGIIVHKKD